MKNFRRTAAWLLALLTLGSTLIACGGSGDGGKETQGTEDGTVTSADDTATETVQLTETQKRQLVDDGVETVDYNQRPFRITYEMEENEPHYYVEAETGDPCADAIWKRNQKIMERFNIVIELAAADVEDAVLTDQDAVDLHMTDAFRMCDLVTQDIIYDWNDVNIINLENPWYNSLANEESELLGTLYGVWGEYSLSTITLSFGMFFNTRLLENYGITSAQMYQTVHDGEWTIDKMISITKDVYEDLNLNNEQDEEDLYGFAYRISTDADAWLIGFDHKLTTRAEDGTLVFQFATEKVESALTKLREWQETNGVYICEDESTADFFVNGHTVFAPLYFQSCFDTLKNMEDVYSVLPYPKWDAAQTDYYINGGDGEMATLPHTLDEEGLEFVGDIFEVLSAETWKTVAPIYYDAALKGRYSKEPETAKMIDIIMKGRNFEFTFQYGDSHLARICWMFRDLLKDPKTPLASKWKTAERLINAKIAQGFYDMFTD
ncbi:MAG: hypothetical protein IJC98_05860 [Clostridia bacterium]|nr:hypothetical protein [Clostridia bacterium]